MQNQCFELTLMKRKKRSLLACAGTDFNKRVKDILNQGSEATNLHIYNYFTVVTVTEKKATFKSLQEMK